MHRVPGRYLGWEGTMGLRFPPNWCDTPLVHPHFMISPRFVPAALGFVLAVVPMLELGGCGDHDGDGMQPPPGVAALTTILPSPAVSVCAPCWQTAGLPGAAGGYLLQQSARPQLVQQRWEHVGERPTLTNPSQSLSTKGTQMSSGTRGAVEQPQRRSGDGVAASLSFLGPSASVFWQSDHSGRRTVEL